MSRISLPQLSELPICDICNKPVDSIEMYYDYSCLVTRYRVKCHGDTDHCSLEDELFHSVKITVGRAFTTKRITNKGQQNNGDLIIALASK